MNSYEMVLVFKPNMEETDRKTVMDRILEPISQNGSLGEINDWGQRRLAYEINYIREGHYYIINFEADPSIITEIERRSRIADTVIRYMVINKAS